MENEEVVNKELNKTLDPNIKDQKNQEQKTQEPNPKEQNTKEPNTKEQNTKEPNTKEQKNKTPLSKEDLINNIMLDISRKEQSKTSSTSPSINIESKRYKPKNTFIGKWENLSKKLKNDVTNLFIHILSSTRVSNKNIGAWVRSFHINAPIYLIINILYARKWIVKLNLYFLAGIFMTFLLLRGCWLSMLEKHFCADDINIVDAILELFNKEVNRINRMKATIIVGISYVLMCLAIYYYRFGIPS